MPRDDPRQGATGIGGLAWLSAGSRTRLEAAVARGPAPGEREREGMAPHEACGAARNSRRRYSAKKSAPLGAVPVLLARISPLELQ